MSSKSYSELGERNWFSRNREVLDSGKYQSPPTCFIQPTYLLTRPTYLLAHSLIYLFNYSSLQVLLYDSFGLRETVRTFLKGTLRNSVNRVRPRRQGKVPVPVRKQDWDRIIRYFSNGETRIKLGRQVNYPI